ncbi:hypothetical protein ACJ72_05344 [Emergomyces africanus]|uniref:Zn(2)-C6 fungal-type domain-containing protein n=1 Tax=Emergomyces africanus TaxID=1955775 RepID=A0A1B7NU79_9EURO|nr:hypothetical protein ACJ72_05344 [Emergomyces africanus]
MTSMDKGCSNQSPINSAEGRPYRSHSYPACLACRKRKSRCIKRLSAQKCVICQVHGTDCFFPEHKHQASSRWSSHSTRRSLARERVSEDTARRALAEQNSTQAADPKEVHSSSPVGCAISPCLNEGEGRAEENPSWGGIFAEGGNKGSHIVSPTMADDSDILESYVTATTETNGKQLVRVAPPASATIRTARPVLFDTVPKRPPGVTSHTSRASEKCELIEKFIQPNARDLIDLFFAKANICVPILDEVSFKNTYLNHQQKISPALLSTIYASALIYWQDSTKLRGIRCPDVNFIWAQACEAVNSEVFLSSGMSTVIALIINVCGRPSTTMLGNGGLIGLAVALSNALGLHRDPSDWNIPTSEKQLRIRIWRMVVVHDRWCSLAYGTPMQIHRAQHDVPIPTAEDLCPRGSSPTLVAATSVFISLVTLTEVLGRYLEYIYHVVKGSPDPFEASTIDPELLLGEWEETLSDDIRKSVMRGTRLDAPGAANLRLSYLAVKLLLRRIQLDRDRGPLPAEDASDCPFYLRAQRAAENIVHFVQELDESHCHGFWIPANAFTLTSATSFLLRSALRSRNSSGNNTPLKLARDMIAALQRHKKDFSWDLSDSCLESCSDMLEKIETGINNPGPALPNFEEYAYVDMSVLDGLFTGFGDPFGMEC